MEDNKSPELNRFVSLFYGCLWALGIDRDHAALLVCGGHVALSKALSGFSSLARLGALALTWPRVSQRERTSAPESMPSRRVAGGDATVPVPEPATATEPQTTSETHGIYLVPDPDLNLSMHSIDVAALKRTEAATCESNDPAERLPAMIQLLNAERMAALQRYVRSVQLPSEVERAISALINPPDPMRLATVTPSVSIGGQRIAHGDVQPALHRHHGRTLAICRDDPEPEGWAATPPDLPFLVRHPGVN